MNVSPRRFPAFILAAAAVAAPLSGAFAQDAEKFEPFIAVVTGDDVYVRSGAADSYYPFAKVHKGDLVRVVGEKFNWARVAAAGPTFQDERFFGYIVHASGQSGRFRLEDDGATGVTLGRTDVLAPNLNAKYNPNDSWKQLARLDADQRVIVMETSTVGNNTVYKVRLPEAAEAWISRSYLRAATPEEAKAWNPPREVRAEADPAAEPAPPAAAAETPSATPPTPETAQPVLAREEQVRPPAPVAEQPAPEETEAPREPGDAGDPTDTHEGDEPLTPADTTTAEKLKVATIDDLEAAYKALRREPVATAEVAPLRRMYLDLASRSNDAGDIGAARFAESRAEQLKLWIDVQSRQAELARIRARARLASERTHAVRESVEAAGDYIAVGRLAVSNIYDGRRLPRLLRLQDTATGRTVAYLEPSETFDLIGMLGQLIGVVGERAYDGGLRLNIVTPRRIDILAPQGP